MLAVLALDYLERLCGIASPAMAAVRSVQEFDFDLRVGMHGRHNGLRILPAYDDVITKTDHASSVA